MVRLIVVILLAMPFAGCFDKPAGRNDDAQSGEGGKQAVEGYLAAADKPRGFSETGSLVSEKQINEDSEEPPYRIAVLYPQFSHISNEEVAEKVNLLIGARVQKQIERFKKDVGELYARKPNLKDKPKSVLAINYKQGVVNDDLACMSLYVSYSNAASNFPLEFEKGYNFDLETGEEIGLRDLFGDGDQYLGELSKLVRQAIVDGKEKRGEYVDESRIEAATLPMPEKFGNFLINPNSLDFYFYYYTISAQREPSVWAEVPYSKLKGIAKPGSLFPKAADSR